MNKEEIKKLDNENIVGMYGRFDVAIESGKASRCWDTAGKEYIDFTAGIGVNSLGFCDEGWVKAVSSQLGKLQHISNLYYTEPQLHVAKMLTERTGLDKVSFANSGAEANEAAIKAARKYGTTILAKKRGIEEGGDSAPDKIVTLKDSFHGRTMATVTATGQDKYHQYFTPFLGGFDYCEANNIEELKNKVDDDTCAIMMEIVQGEGGVRDLTEDFIKTAATICKEKDILLILDEVQTGVGRAGKLFAYEHFGIDPDIVTFAKGVGGGLPIGGAIYSKKCSDILQPGDHGTTFGANPVVCAGAQEVLSRIDGAFLKEVIEKGEYIREKLATLPGVKSLSGKGLMIGIEIDEDATGGVKAIDIVKDALEKGLLLLTAADRVRLLPPLNISYEEIDAGLEILGQIKGFSV